MKGRIIKLKSSDIITAFILKMLEESDGSLELQRNELAQKFNVVPSQINYVMTSRFTPEQGYVIESKRGGGGYIRIHRVQYDKCEHIMHIVNSIGKSINEFNAILFLKNMVEYGYISNETHFLMRIAISDKTYSTIPPDMKDELRAAILKNMLTIIVT